MPLWEREKVQEVLPAGFFGQRFRKVVAEVQLDSGRRVGLALAVPAGEASVSDLRAEEHAGNALFNGRDLDGWGVPR